jgi:hypothetical protein
MGRKESIFSSGASFLNLNDMCQELHILSNSGRLLGYCLGAG